MSKFPTDIYKEVVYNGIKTTKGRVIFNEALPKGYIDKFGFINEPLNKKLISKVLENVFLYFPDEYMETINKLQQLANFYATVFPKSLLLDGLELPPELKEKKKKLEKITDINEYIKLANEISKEYKEWLKQQNHPIGDLIDSGASKGKVTAMVVGKGPVKTLTGDIELIPSDLSEGLTPVEFFKSGNVARGGLADRVLNTAHTGYLERKLVYAFSVVTLSEDVSDCKTSKTLDIVFNKDMKDKILGRWYVNEAGMIQQITLKNIDQFEDGQRIQLRSPIYCQNPEICHTCYGDLYKRINTRNIGLLAAIVLGERGTQSIMKTFHTGGTIDIKPVDIITKLLYYNQNYTREDLEKIFWQDGFDLYTKYDLVVIIDKKKYDKDQIQFDTNNKAYKLGIVNIIITDGSNLKLNLLLDLSGMIPVELDKYKETDDKIFIRVFKDNILLKTEPDLSGVNFQYMRKVFEKSIKSEDEYQLFYRVYEIYKELGSVDNVHIEVIVSEMCRDPDDPTKPFRMNPNAEKPNIVSIKELPYLTNPKMGLFFENPQKAIETALVFDEWNVRETPITKLADL